MTVAEQFGEAVRDLRHQREFSQRSLGEIAGLHRTAMYLLENGSENLGQTIVVVADALSIDPSFLVVG